MNKFMAGFGAAVALFGLVALYACLAVASRADRLMEEDMANYQRNVTDDSAEEQDEPTEE